MLASGSQCFSVRPPGIIRCPSVPMQDVYRELDNVAATDCSIMLLGETGVGRKTLARLVHSRSPRSAGPFVVLLGASIPDGQFERELFAPVRDFFTGADRDRSADGAGALFGSVLVEDVDQLSSEGQRMLMQCVEMATALRPGKNEARGPGVRFLASAGPDFERRRGRAGFLDRLFFALGVVTIHVPPLRARTADTIPLAKHFLSHYAQRYGKLGSRFSERSLAALTTSAWRGNIDELRSTVERAVLLSVGGLVTLDDLGLGTEPGSKGRTPVKTRLENTQEEVEAALRATQGNVTRAAEMLVINRRKLQRLMRRFGLDRTSFESGVEGQD